ncbi:hypothetical protein V1282_003996 [Nitrobacteraceae bacterium AZCC 2146]
MRVKKKIMVPAWLEQSAGFRICPNGEVEVMTQVETEAVVNRAIREAMYSAGWPWFVRTLH